MKRVLKLCVILFAMFIGINYVDAFSIGAGSTTLASGQTTKLTINASGLIGKFSISTSNASVISASEGSVWIEDGSYSITLSALNVGSATITVTAADVSDTAGNPASGAQSVTINVVNQSSSTNNKNTIKKDKKDMSKNNDLKSLSVEGFTLTPEFSKDTLEYSVTVPEDTKEINIIAQAADSYASIDGNGKQEVTSGINSFEIVVRAENGDKKTYKINVEVKDENPIEVKIDNKKYTVVKVADMLEKPDGYEEKTIKIKDQDVPAFYNKITKITLVGLKDEKGNIDLYIYDNNKYTKYNEIKSNQLSVLPLELKDNLKGYEKTTVKIDGVEVQAYKYAKDLSVVIIYGLNTATGEKDYYLYDKTDKTLMTYNDDMINSLQNKVNMYTYVIIGLASAFVILFIVLIVVAKKKKKTNKIDSEDTKKEKKRKDKNDIFEL